MSDLYPMFRTNYLDRWCLRYARKRIENGKAYYVCMALPPIIGNSTKFKIEEVLSSLSALTLPAACKNSREENIQTRLCWIDMLLENSK